MTAEGGRPPRNARPDPPEVTELLAIKTRQPELSSAVDLHLELLALEKRVRGRIPLPAIVVSAELMTRCNSSGRPLLRFEDIPIEPSDLRLLVRQTADLLLRHSAIEEADHARVQALGRDPDLVDAVRTWYEDAGGSSGQRDSDAGGMAGEVLGLAMRPYLTRAAEVLQQRPELALWTNPSCPLCGGSPNLALITPSAERQLICSRCELRWSWQALTCPFCRNDDRGRITSFATPDGRYRVYGCDACRRYLKAYDGRRQARLVVPLVELVATLPLDAAAIQRGYTA